MNAAVWGLIGTIVGALASMGAAFLTTRASQRALEAKVREERLDRFRSFQQETLFKLAENLHEFLRLYTRAYVEDREAHDAHGTWQRSPLSDEVNEGLMLSARKVSILIERVADDDLRHSMKQLMGAAAARQVTHDVQAGEQDFLRTTVVGRSVLEQLGAVLRATY